VGALAAGVGAAVGALAAGVGQRPLDGTAERRPGLDAVGAGLGDPGRSGGSTRRRHAPAAVASGDAGRSTRARHGR